MCVFIYTHVSNMLGLTEYVFHYFVIELLKQ